MSEIDRLWATVALAERDVAFEERYLIYYEEQEVDAFRKTLESFTTEQESS